MFLHLKPVIFLGASLALLASGCDKKSESPPPASTNATATATGTSPLDAPGGYLKALAKGQQSAVKTVDTTSLDKAIQMFNVDQGRNPKDLDELVQKKYMPQIPAAPYGMKIVYDANAGTVKMEKQ
jgi:hypothetical protein